MFALPTMDAATAVFEWAARDDDARLANVFDLPFASAGVFEVDAPGAAFTSLDTGAGNALLPAWSATARSLGADTWYQPSAVGKRLRPEPVAIAGAKRPRPAPVDDVEIRAILWNEIAFGVAPAPFQHSGPAAVDRTPTNDRYATRVACVRCSKHKLRCDTQRPCRRCVQSGAHSSCADRQHAAGRRRRRRCSGVIWGAPVAADAPPAL